MPVSCSPACWFLLGLGLAAGVWRFPRRRELLLVIALAMLAVVAFDAREVVHQADENRGGLALLAGLIGALHLAAAAIAAVRPTALRRVTATMGR